jgi:hypothetical protein
MLSQWFSYVSTTSLYYSFLTLSINIKLISLNSANINDINYKGTSHFYHLNKSYFQLKITGVVYLLSSSLCWFNKCTWQNYAVSVADCVLNLSYKTANYVVFNAFLGWGNILSKAGWVHSHQSGLSLMVLWQLQCTFTQELIILRILLISCNYVLAVYF